jgi:hypothetical protein
LVDLALESYVTGWNTALAAPALDLEVLHRSQRCARLLWIVEELEDWFERLARGDDDPELSGWAKRGAEDLLALLATLASTL